MGSSYLVISHPAIDTAVERSPIGPGSGQIAWEPCIAAWYRDDPERHLIDIRGLPDIAPLTRHRGVGARWRLRRW